MGWLPTSIVPREAHFAHVDFCFRLTEIYVPFGPQTRLAVVAEAFGDAVDGGAVDLEELGNEGWGVAAVELEDNEVARAGAGVAAVGEVFAQALLDEEGEFGEDTTHGPGGCQAEGGVYPMTGRLLRLPLGHRQALDRSGRAACYAAWVTAFACRR